MSSSLSSSKIPLPVKSRIPVPTSSVKLTKNLPASSETLRPLNKNTPDSRTNSYVTSKFLHSKKIAKDRNNLKNAGTFKKNFHEKFSIKPNTRKVQQTDQQNSKMKVKIKDENVPSPVLKTKPAFSRNKQITIKKSIKPTSGKQSLKIKAKIKDENLPPLVLTTKPAVSKNEQVIIKKNVQPRSDCIVESVEKPKHLALQEDIHFEPNEFYRNLILKERHLSPSILNMNPGTKLSSVMVERPSVYKKMPIVKNPVEEAMKEIENLKLENKRISQLKQNAEIPVSPKVERPSIYKKMPVFKNPVEEAMKEIENIKLEKKRISQFKQNEAIPVSPKERYSIYKRFPLSDDPFQEAMKSLEVLKAKSKVKSAKKVRFCLVHDESPTSKNEKDLPESLTSESRLTNISEKSEENTPEVIPEASTEKPSVSSEKPICSEPNKVTCTSQLLHQNTFTSSVKLESAVNKNASSNFLPSVLSSCNQAVRYPSSSTPFVKSSKKENVFSTCSNSASHAIKSNHVKHSVRDADRLIPNSLKCVRNESKGLLNSPRPLLLHMWSNHIQDISPEILNKCDSRLLLEAPICTPLVLKGLANDSALKLSPIRQKLDFLEEEDKVAQDDTSPIFRIPSINVEHICTQKKILDQLADKECGYFLSSAAFPIISGRYLCDPIAHILTEGDEMHFVPVKEEISL